MVYEDMTYEVILDRMINRVTEVYPNLDYREGSIIYNALASAAMELAIAYVELDNVRNESFVKTASREYILISCEDMGMDVSIFEEHAGTHKGEFNVEVPIGSRWNCDIYNYTVDEFIGTRGDYYEYKLICDTPGTAPNKVTGDLIAISDSPSGLIYARLVECLIEGENETSDDDVRTAYYNHINRGATDGNIDQYEKWCNEYDGIGNYKIFPLWNGANTVKVSILSASNSVATETLIQEFQQYLDPGVKGMGDGVAPIGSFVTVTTATEKPINIEADVTMKNGYTDTTPLSEAIEKYFRNISYNQLKVSYLGIGAEILKVEGVDSVNNLFLNSNTDDITLEAESIPVLGTMSWRVV